MRDWVLLQPTAAHVANYANHGEPIIILSSRILTFEALADRVNAGPISSCHALVDDRNQWRVWNIIWPKVTASQQRSSHCLEIIAPEGGPTERSPVVSLLWHLPLNGPQTKVAYIPELEESVDFTCRFDCWDVSDPLQHRVIENASHFRTCGRKSHTYCENVLRFKAGINSPQCHEAPHEKSRPGKQHNSKGEFAYNQSRAGALTRVSCRQTREKGLTWICAGGFPSRRQAKGQCRDQRY